MIKLNRDQNTSNFVPSWFAIVIVDHLVDQISVKARKEAHSDNIEHRPL